MPSPAASTSFSSTYVDNTPIPQSPAPARIAAKSRDMSPPRAKAPRCSGGVRKPRHRGASRASPRGVREVAVVESDGESDYEVDVAGAQALLQTLRDGERDHEALTLRMVLDGEEDHCVAMLVLRMLGCLKRRVRTR